MGYVGNGNAKITIEGFDSAEKIISRVENKQ
jgi:hypothetical protein